MSLILDALNRADQERSDDQPLPDLKASQTPPPDPSEPWRRWLVEAVVVGAAIAILIVSLWNRDDDGGSDRNNDRNSDRESAATARLPTQSAPAPSPAQSAGAAALSSVPVTAPVTTQAAKAAANPPPGATTPASNQPTSASPDPAVAKLYQQPIAPPPVISPKVSKPKTVAPKQPVTTKPAPQPAPVATAAADGGLSVLQTIPLLTERSLRFQRKIPSIDYAMHVYAEDSGNGFVMMNGEKRRVGSQLAPDLRVIAILENSTVLDYQGIQFRLDALNSWVNFN